MSYSGRNREPWHSQGEAERSQTRSLEAEARGFRLPRKSYADIETQTRRLYSITPTAWSLYDNTFWSLCITKRLPNNGTIFFDWYDAMLEYWNADWSFLIEYHTDPAKTSVCFSSSPACDSASVASCNRLFPMASPRPPSNKNAACRLRGLGIVADRR
jgi:hypothetical protein